MKTTLLLFLAFYTSPDCFCQTAHEYFIKGKEKQDLNDYRGALVYYDSAIILAPNDSKLYLRRGLARNHEKDYQGANEDYTTSLTLKPEREMVVIAYICRGNLKDYLGLAQ